MLMVSLFGKSILLIDVFSHMYKDIFVHFYNAMLPWMYSPLRDEMFIYYGMGSNRHGGGSNKFGSFLGGGDFLLLLGGG